MYDFRRIALFCVEKRLSKQKITIFSKNVGDVAPLATPMRRSHIFRFRLRSCSKILHFGYLFSKYFEFENPTSAQDCLPSTQPKFSNAFTLEMICIKTRQTPATAENKKMTPDSGPVYHNFFIQAPREKRRILPESIPALRIRGHLCFLALVGGNLIWRTDFNWWHQKQCNIEDRLVLVYCCTTTTKSL